MSDVNLAAIDLNLLHVIATVLEEKSATRAARKLRVTQSAVSNALRRARELFQDDLVVRRPHGLEPTPLGRTLLPALRSWVEETQRLLSDVRVFDPRTSTRTFSIACSDAVTFTLLQSILHVLAELAPQTQLRLYTLDRLYAEDGLRRGIVDLLIGIPPVLPEDVDAELVYRDELECIVRADHPRVGKTLSLDDFASLPHVEVALFEHVVDTVDRALARHGRTRRVQVALPHFSSLPLAVVETDCIAIVSRALARMFSQWLPLRVLRPPIEIEPVAVRQVWHRRAARDGAVLFLRDVVRKAVQRNAAS